MKKYIFSLLCLFAVSCSMPDSDTKEGIRQLEHLGYTEIVAYDNTDVFFNCCGEGYNYTSKFTAKDQDGTEVHGCICATLGKSVVVKFIAE